MLEEGREGLKERFYNASVWAPQESVLESCGHQIGTAALFQISPSSGGAWLGPSASPSLSFQHKTLSRLHVSWGCFLPMCSQPIQFSSTFSFLIGSTDDGQPKRQARVLEPPCSESSLSEHDGWGKVYSTSQVPSGSSPVRWRRWLQGLLLRLVLRMTPCSAPGLQKWRGLDWKSAPGG